MSSAACAKKILCDPSRNKVEALYNTLKYLESQSKSDYKNDPSELLNLKENIYNAITPALETAIGEALKVLKI